ncbi:MAG: class I SAM-dependent methyltransferase, partial [Candidatus Cloacimonetes bacterium]|nr:class I SAM-dependent methyltransferase [Candidatus Cloacimonadota bacterium]
RDNTGVLVEPSTYLRGDGIMTRYCSEENIRTLSHNFIITEMKRIEWSMRIRGRDYIRAVISAILRKP